MDEELNVDVDSTDEATNGITAPEPEENTENKTLTVTSSTDLDSDVEITGNPDIFVVLTKVVNKREGWMKSTKAMQLPHGCLIQVTTQQGDNVAEALEYVPNVRISIQNGNRVLI